MITSKRRQKKFFGVLLGVYRNNTRCVKKGRLAAASAISNNKIKCQVIGFSH
jgi:hypothetical protein